MTGRRAALRFFGILFLQFMKRTLSHFRKKQDTTDEAARTWLYRSCIKNEFANVPENDLLSTSFESIKPDSVNPPVRTGSHQLPKEAGRRLPCTRSPVRARAEELHQSENERGGKGV